MSTSELRRGPGWWMDLEGEWNPPEKWPEESPPLPGWTRGTDGLWSEPAFPDNMHDELDEQLRHDPAIAESPSLSAKRPVLDLGAPSIPPLDSLKGDPPDRRATSDRRAAPTKAESLFTFAEGTAAIPVFDDGSRHRQRAVVAATLAAVTASMLAAGLILLLLLL